MKRKLIVFLTFSALTTAAGKIHAAGWNFNIESRIYSNMLTGSTEQAVVAAGTFHEENLNIGYYRKSDRGYTLRGGAAARVTSDRGVSKQDFRLRNYFFTIADEVSGHAATAGDSYVNFSRYVFNRNVEGISGVIKVGKNSTVKPLYGYTARAENGVSYARAARGARVEHAFSGKARIGAGYAASSDEPSSISDDALLPAREGNSVSGFDAAFAAGDFAFEGEYAASTYEEFKSPRRETGAAWRIKTVYRRAAVRAEGEYEIVDSSFNTVGGWAVKDRVSAKTRLMWNVSERLNADMSYENLRNNLNNRLPYSESASVPKITLTMFPSKNANFFVSYSVRNNSSDDAARTVDRNVATTGAGAEFLLGPWRPAVTIETNRTDDRAAPINNFVNTYADLSLRTSVDAAGGWKISPVLGWRATSDKYDALPSEDTAGTLMLRATARGPKYAEIAGYFNDTTSERRSNAARLTRRNMGIETLFKINGSENKTVALAYSSNEYENTGAAQAKYGDRTVETRLRLKF